MDPIRFDRRRNPHSPLGFTGLVMERDSKQIGYIRRNDDDDDDDCAQMLKGKTHQLGTG